MARYRVRAAAAARLDDIAAYSRDRWGREQAVVYIDGLFEHFDAIANRRVPWTRISAALGVDGYRGTWGSHVIYWKERPYGVAIISVLHKRMDQIARLRDDLRS